MLGLDDLKTAQTAKKEEKGVKVQDEAGGDRLEPTPRVEAGELDLLAVGRAVGMENLDTVKKNSLRLEKLMLWANQKGAKDQLGYVAEIKSLMHRLGTRSIHDLYVYTRLDMDRMDTEAKLRKMEKP